MKSAVWVIAWLCVGLWSAVAALGYWLLNALTGFAANNADMVSGNAETVELVNWAALLFRDFGEIAVLVVWVVISLLILAIAWLITRLTGGTPQAQPPVRS